QYRAAVICDNAHAVREFTEQLAVSIDHTVRPCIVQLIDDSVYRTAISSLIRQLHAVIHRLREQAGEPQLTVAAGHNAAHPLDVIEHTQNRRRILLRITLLARPRTEA